MKYPRSPYDTVGNLVYFGRMVDKIRLMAAGELSPDFHANLGKGFDERCVKFLRVSYETLAARVREGLSDQALLEWCYDTGRRPDDEAIEVWNEFLRKRGWNDAASEILERRIKESGFENRTDILTMFDYLDADEGRK